MGKRFISHVCIVFGMVYVICVTEECNYARYLFLATIVMIFTYLDVLSFPSKALHQGFSTLVLFIIFLVSSDDIQHMHIFYVTLISASKVPLRTLYCVKNTC